MRVIAILDREVWRLHLTEAVRDRGTLTFATDARHATEELARNPCDVVVADVAALPVEPSGGADGPPEVLALVDDVSMVAEALRRGATDCEVGDDPTRLRARLEIVVARRVGLRPLRAEADALRKMTTATSGWRYWEFDLETERLRHVQPAGPTTRGLATDALAARAWDSLHSEASRSLIRRTVRDQLEQYRASGAREPRQLQLEMENADETLGHRLVTAWLALDEAGRPRLWRGITHDITDRVRASTSLATVQASFDALVGVLPLPVFRVDGRGNVLSWNEAAAATFGFSTAEVVGHPVPLIELGKTSWPPAAEWGAAEHGADAGRETVVLGKGGEPIDVWIWTRPIREASGEPPSTVFLLADITAKKRTELDYQQLFESAHDAILVLDPEGEIVLDVNSRGCELYGFAREELVGRSLMPLTIDVDRGSRRIAETLASGSLVRFETVQRKKDGTPMHLDVNASCVEYRGKKAILSINRDVTDRKAQEEEIRRRDLALADATRLDAVGRLAGGVAHDFNNLLMVIDSGIEALAASRSATAETNEDFADLVAAVDRAKALVTQLLTFANRALTEPRILDVGDVVRRLDGILRRLVREDIAIGIHVNPDVSPVRADPSQLEQVVVNLVVNARDAIDGVGTIDVFVRSAAASGFVDLVVRDDGCGMDEATRSRIFEPFFTTKGAGKGTGLGLATVHGIVRGLGGEVMVTSAPGEGTEIIVRIPAADGRPSRPDDEDRQRKSRPGAECILLVEDEQAVRRILSRQLAKLGYHVLESTNGVAALELARAYQDRIDMVVTDVVMPHMGGDELATQLRAERPDLKVLFMTGHVEGPPLASIVNRGPILSKPFGLAKLTEALRQLLDD